MAAVQFRISSFLKDLIGRELITDEFVAVFELVKNSFDANAKTVKVIFEHQYDPENAKIIIWDDGYGMNINDLNNKWSFTETDTIYSIGDTVKLYLRNFNHTDSDLSDDKISKVERIKED